MQVVLSILHAAGYDQTPVLTEADVVSNASQRCIPRSKPLGRKHRGHNRVEMHGPAGAAAAGVAGARCGRSQVSCGRAQVLVNTCAIREGAEQRIWSWLGNARRTLYGANTAAAQWRRRRPDERRPVVGVLGEPRRTAPSS